MSLLTYAEVRPWARAIKMRTGLRSQRGAMPPWFVERDLGIQRYKNDISLNEEEIKKIAVWADNGAPLGNPADLPAPLEFGDEQEWAIGVPDLILESPAVTVPATAADKWTNLGTIPTGLTEDRYVAAVEVKEFNDIPPESGGDTVGGRYVFHHMTYASVVPDGVDAESSTRFPVHEVGRNADIFPENAGRLLTAGAALELETAHLHANGRETQAHLKFAFKLHPEGYEPEIRHARTLVGNGVDIDIKPDQAEQELHAYRVLDEHTKVVSFEPHQHAPGTRMCLEAIWGHNIETLTCVGYDHNWVKQYIYDDDYAPLLPKGTILHIIGWLDTTVTNRNVADPRNWSGGGRRSVANMFIDLGEALELTAADVLDYSRATTSSDARCVWWSFPRRRSRRTTDNDDREGWPSADSWHGVHMAWLPRGLAVVHAHGLGDERTDQVYVFPRAEYFASLRGVVGKRGRHVHVVLRLHELQLGAGTGCARRAG